MPKTELDRALTALAALKTPDITKLQQMSNMIDLLGPETVLITINKKTVWVNVDGICVLRITRAASVVVEDER